MKGTMVVIKPGTDEVETTHWTQNIPLELIQKAVDGYIEEVPYFNRIKLSHKKIVRCVAFCNEDGKRLGLPYNDKASRMWWQNGYIISDKLVGNVVIIYGDKEFMEAL